MLLLRRVLPAVLLAALAVSAQAQARKVLVSVDMEGIAGVVTGEQLGPPGFEYERFRLFMTNEALAAIEGARAGGATEILVVDSHGNGQNLLIEKFPKDVQIIRAWPRPLAMVQGDRDRGRRHPLHRLPLGNDEPSGRARAHDVLGQPGRHAL